VTKINYYVFEKKQQIIKDSSKWNELLANTAENNNNLAISTYETNNGAEKCATIT